MPIYAGGDKVPRIHPAFIALTATIAGDVTVHAGASVSYGAVVRGDTSCAVIGPGANVQDGAVVHGRADLAAIIEPEASVAHNAIIHGARIGEWALIGIKDRSQGTWFGRGSRTTQGTWLPTEGLMPPRRSAVGGYRARGIWDRLSGAGP